jgi:hypothetical protein
MRYFRSLKADTNIPPGAVAVTASDLVKKLGCQLLSGLFIVEIPSPKMKAKLGDVPVTILLKDATFEQADD